MDMDWKLLPPSRPSPEIRANCLLALVLRRHRLPESVAQDSPREVDPPERPDRFG